ncbi:MAG: gamma-glutamylcyclotransferase [Nannocystaceae bacterium]
MTRREALWVFGYGSLVWRPAFPFVERRPAFVVGWQRRFFQGSTDHRGVPGAPGRVVTLVEAPAERCFGVVYRVAPEEADAVLAGLDVREQGGYDRRFVEARAPAGGIAAARALLYLATPDNPNYLGAASLPAIAAQILRSRGPSGANVEYLLRLAEALRAMDADDPHVFALERMVRSRLAEP